MKIVILGAMGFIGKNLLKALPPEHEYICLVRKQSDCEACNSNRIAVKKIDFSYDALLREFDGRDVVINLIGQMGGSGITEKMLEETNCDLTQKVVDACKAVKIKQCIYLSTPGVQGFGTRLCKENAPYAPRNPYEQTKVRAEEIVIDALDGTSTKYTILRPDFVYGPGDFRRIKMYRNIRDKKFVLTTSGKSYLHPTYVMDVVQGIVKAIGNENAYDQIFNISAEEDITAKNYLNIIADYFGVRLIHINIGHPLSKICADVIDRASRLLLKKEGFVSKNKIDFLAMDHSTSIEKAKELLGYSPQYDFKRGFKETMQWCEERKLL